MLNFRGRKPGLLGVDIGSSAVKLVELQRNGAGWHLLGYVIQPLPAGVVVEHKVMEIGAFGQSLRQALAALKPATRNAAVAVPTSAVISRSMELAADLGDEEMEGQLLLEAEQFIPYPLAEVVIDFAREQQVGEGADPAREQVLLTACRRDNVESRVAALRAGGLEVKVVDVESCAMERACTLLPPGTAVDLSGLVALVDVGSALTTLHVLRAGRCLYTREQLAGGHHSAEGVARQVERSLQLFYSSSESYGSVDGIVLAGGMASMPGIAALLSERLGRPVTAADPVARLTLGVEIDREALREHAPALMAACGLALRG